MRLALAFLLLLSQTGCAALQRGTPPVRPSLLLDQVPLHGAILNPDPPPYGFGVGFCIAQQEFRIELTDLAIAEDGRLRIAGTIVDADPRTGGPVLGVRISRRIWGTAVPFHVAARQLDVLVDVDEGAVLMLERIAYRTLLLDLNRLAAVARRVRRLTP